MGKQVEEEAEKAAEKRKLAIENKLVQDEINAKKKKKRKSEADTPSGESKIPKMGGFDYENVDFNKMFTNKAPTQSNDFRPVQSNKKDNRGNKQKFKSKNDGKSATFK